MKITEGQAVECVVCAWHPDPGGRGHGRGFCKVLGDPKDQANRRVQSERPGLYLRECHVVSGDPDTLRPGSLIQAEVGPEETEPGKTRLALNVVILNDAA